MWEPTSGEAVKADVFTCSGAEGRNSLTDRLLRREVGGQAEPFRSPPSNAESEMFFPCQGMTPSSVGF